MTNQQPEPRKINASLYLDLLEQHDQLNRNLANLVEGALEPAYCIIIMNPVNGEPHAYWNTSSPLPPEYILSRGLELLRVVRGAPNVQQPSHQTSENSVGQPSRNIRNDVPEAAPSDNGTGTEHDEPAEEPLPFIVDKPINVGNLSDKQGEDFIQTILEGRD